MAPVARPRQVALVTGSASGLGAALCVELASRGYAVAATARAGSSDPRLTETVARAREAAGGDEGAAAAFQCDVTSPTSCAACVERVVGELGPVDLLVCNAGGTRFGPMLEQPVDEVRAVFEVNVFGVLHTIQAAMPSMCERRRGKVLIIGSVSATLTTPFAGAYSASKAAVHEIAEALRMEVERYSVSVSVAVLGSFKSGFGGIGNRNVWSLGCLKRQSQLGVKISRGEHILNDVTATNEFALNIELRNGRPVGKALDSTSYFWICQYIDGLVVVGQAIQDLDYGRGKTALGHNPRAFHK